MKLFSVLTKTLREMGREWVTLFLTLVFAPVFVLIYWLITYGGSTSYTILVINHDRGGVMRAGEEVAQAIADVRYADGKPLLRIAPAADMEQAQALLRARRAVAYVEIPADFSDNLQRLHSGDRSASTNITFGGDLTNPYYVVGASLAITAVDDYVQQITGQKPLIGYVERPLGASAARTEFENYTPGILVFAVILMVFLAAMIVAREVEAGTLSRLRLTPLSSFEFLGGVTAALALVAVVAVLLTFATAVALGFRSQGPLWAAVLICAMTSLSVIGVGLLVACFSKTVSQAFIIANFPLGFFMFFSGAMYPLPKMVLFTVAGYEIGLYDILPPTHAVAALNKVLTLGAGLDEVIFELAALTVLSVVYFAAGVWLFQSRYLRSGVR